LAAWPFITERRFDLAKAQLQRVLELDRNFPEAHNFLAQCYEAQSNYLAAIEEYKTYFLLDGDDPERVAASCTTLRQAYQTQGAEGYFRKCIELTLAEDSFPPEKQIHDPGNLAGYYARLGEKQKALDEIEKHFDDVGVWWQIKFEPAYDSLHEEPRFKALLKRGGFEK